MELKKYKRPRVIPIGWKEIKIGQEFRTSSGATPLSSESSYYEGGTIPWINSGELASPYIYNAKNYITQKGYENSSTELYPKDTVLVAMCGATAGKASLLKMEACTNQAVCAILPNKEYSPEFIKYNIDTLYEHLVGLSSGSARDNLSQTDLKELKLLIPQTKKEQEKLSSILSSLDRKIELNKRINDNLEAMAKQLYDYWFVQFDFPNEEGKPYKSSGGAMVWNEKLKREIPEGWSCDKLTNVLLLLKDGTHNPPSRVNSGIALLTGTMFGKNFLDYSKATYIEDTDYKAIHKQYQPQKGDIIMTKIGTLGNINILRNADIPIAIHCNSALLRFASDWGEPFPFWMCKSPLFQARLKAVKGQSIQEFASLEKIGSINIEIPPIRLIELFNNTINKVLGKQILISYEIAELTKQRDELLPLLMNGQVSVNYH